MDKYLFYFVLFFALTNVIAFLMMWIDKRKAQKNKVVRISEGMLFFMATVFGSVGVYAGMFTFRHKTKKWYFVIGIPLLMVQNIALLWAVYFFLTLYK